MKYELLNTKHRYITRLVSRIVYRLISREIE